MLNHLKLTNQFSRRNGGPESVVEIETFRKVTDPGYEQKRDQTLAAATNLSAQPLYDRGTNLVLAQEFWP